MNRILIIGISGFLGSNIARHLINTNSAAEAKGLSREPSRIPETSKEIECVPGDITDPSSLAGRFKGIHTVIHVATKVRAADPKEFHETNVIGMKNIIDTCLREGVERIIYVSNASVYGMEPANDAVEHEPLRTPTTPVSASRFEAEKLLLSSHREKTIEVLILRPLFVYGRGDEFFIPPIARSLNRIPFFINGGKAKLSVISVDDVADIVLTLSQQQWQTSEFPVYHLNDGFPTTFKEIVMALHLTLQIPLPRIDLPYAIALLGLSFAGLKNKIFPPNNRTGNGRSISTNEFVHRIHLISFDHYYSNARLMRQLPQKKFLPFEQKFQQYLDFYINFLFRNRN